MIKPFRKIWLRLIHPSDMMPRCQTIHQSKWLMAAYRHHQQQQHHKQVKKLVKHRLHRKTITNSTNRTISTQQITSFQRHPCTNTHKMSNIIKQYISVILNRSVVYPLHCFVLIIEYKKCQSKLWFSYKICTNKCAFFTTQIIAASVCFLLNTKKKFGNTTKLHAQAI